MYEIVSAGQAGKIDAFLKRADKWGFCKNRVTLNELVNKSGLSVFQKMQTPNALSKSNVAFQKDN